MAKVRFILTQLQQAIKGEVVMTEELQETLYAVYDAKVEETVYNNACHANVEETLMPACMCDASRLGRFICVPVSDSDLDLETHSRKQTTKAAHIDVQLMRGGGEIGCHVLDEV